MRPGQRVKALGDLGNGGPARGTEGIVVVIQGGRELPIGVEWDSTRGGGHDLAGYSPNHKGWWVNSNQIRVVEYLSPLQQEVYAYLNKELKQ